MCRDCDAREGQRVRFGGKEGTVVRVQDGHMDLRPGSGGIKMYRHRLLHIRVDGDLRKYKRYEPDVELLPH